MTNDSKTATQRDELAREIWLADRNRAAAAWGQPSPDDYTITDRLISKGYRKPRTIADQHEENGPDDLRPLSVVLSDGKPAILQHDGTFMDYDGSSWDVWEMTYPLIVIHEPEAEATR